MAIQKRILLVFAVVGLLLLIPFIAMQFNDQVQWSGFDFLIATGLLLTAGLTVEYVLRKVQSLRQRVILLAVLLGALFLVWAELAVGIFGTPFAGS